MQRQPLTNVDSLLYDYLNASDPHEEKWILERLANELRVIVTRVLATRFGRERERIEDACQDCLLAILGKIDRLKRNPDEPRVMSLTAYAAATAQNAFRGEMRQQNPERNRLRQRLLDLVKQNPDQLAIWSVDGAVLCGLAGWEGRSHQRTTRYEEWVLGQGPFLSACLENRSPVSEAPLEDVVIRLLGWIETPLPLNDMVSQVGELLQLSNDNFAGISSQVLEVLDQANDVEQLPDVKENIEDFAVESIHRETVLRRAWEEILQLPIRQRTALLFALSPEAFMAYRLLVGPAALCSCLELSRAEIDALPARLPVSDAELAAAMRLKRQQVINFRLSARQRLARRVPQE